MVNRQRLIWPLGLMAALIVCGSALALVHNQHMRARLLITPPDAVPGIAETMQYALPRGERGYRAHCAGCHGAHLEGDGRIGAPNLRDRDWLYGSGRVVQIERVIQYGIRSGLPKSWNLADMPAFARAEPYKRYRLEPLTPGEVSDLASYLLSFHDAHQEPGSVQRGSKLFHNGERGVCFDCHSADARGDSAIGAPDLTDAVWLYGTGTRDSIERSIEVGRAGVCPGGANQLTADEVREIALYVYSRQRN